MEETGKLAEKYSKGIEIESAEFEDLADTLFETASLQLKIPTEMVIEYFKKPLTNADSSDAKKFWQETGLIDLMNTRLSHPGLNKILESFERPYYVELNVKEGYLQVKETKRAIDSGTD